MCPTAGRCGLSGSNDGLDPGESSLIVDIPQVELQNVAEMENVVQLGSSRRLSSRGRIETEFGDVAVATDGIVVAYARFIVHHERDSEKLHFNTEWVAFGGFVQDTTARVIPSLVDYEGNQEDMEVRMENIFIALHEAKAEIDRLQNMYPWRREVASLQDSRTIFGLNDQISRAVSSFFVSSSAVPAKINSQSPGMYQRTPGRSISEVATSDLGIAPGAMVRNREIFNGWLGPNTASFYTTGISGNNTNVAGNYYGDNYYGVDEEQLALKMALDGLPLTQCASWNQDLVCLPGTRLSVFSVIHEWLRSPGHQRLFLLKGVAGSGKTAIAHSIAQMLYNNDPSSPISSFFFARHTATPSTSHYLFTTIARHIASWHHAFAADVGGVLQRDPNLPWAPLSRQFEALICAPLRRNPARRPIIIVIDTLDQGISSESEATLSILFREAVDLPPNLRFFITSRPTKHVEQQLCGKRHVKSHVIEIDSDENQRDIAFFVDAELRDDCMKYNMGNAEPDEDMIRDLIAMSEGLFAWITAAFRYLRGVSNPAQEIRLLVSTSGLQECPTIHRTMNALCATILEACIGDDWRDERLCRNYQHIIGVIVAARRPLSLATLQALHSDKQSLQDLLKQFDGIIVENREDQEPTFRILHISFRGFIMDRSNNPETRKFHIAEKERIEELANLCLQITELRRTLAAEQVAEKSAELAASLHNLHFRLYTLGRQEEALTAIQEAAALYRAGAAERPVVFNDHLANSLRDLSIQLDNCGQPEESLKVAEEVTILRRELMKAEAGAILQSLDTILNKIKRITDIAVGLVDTLAKAYEQRKEIDAAVLALFKQMETFYSFVDDFEGSLLGKIEQLEAVITRALEQTIECGVFLREYTAHGCAGHALKQDGSNCAQMISELQSKLGQLRDNVNSELVTPTAFLSSQTKRGADRLAGYDLLHGLKPTDMNAAERPLCLPGTQQARLEEVIGWLLTPSSQNVLWLHGAAGLGKSTIATTIAAYFGDLRRRGAFLFFDRNAPLESAPSRVITTLAFQLAQQNAAIRSAVSAAIEGRPELVSAPLATQFKSLLVEPLVIAAAHIEGPIIVVLDALDECGDARSRQKLLELLSKDLTKLLPGQLRILITSRPEHDISCALASRSHIRPIDLSAASDADMQVYIKHEMRRIYENRRIMDELPEGWGNAAIDILVGYAAGLFIWAATAMRLLSDADFPKKYLSELLRHDRPFFTLHELYEKALRSASSWEPGDTTNVYSGILGLIIIGQVPLTEVTIAAMLGYQDDVGTCRTALRRLASVIRWSEGQPARMLHKSFPDYLTKHCSSEPWFINVEEHHHTLSNACLRVMNERLHFNMCSLTTSHIPNEQIIGLSGRVETAIPQTLSYSCLFWGYHVQKTVITAPSLLQMILAFFQEKFLYWLEVLSLMGEMRFVSQTMVAVRESIKVSKQCVLFADSYKPKLKFATNQNPGSEVDAFAQDGLAFSRRFGQAMAFSTPHIYISCMPFAPQESVIKQRYTPLMKKILAIKSGMDATWPVLQQAIEHPSAVIAVAFSPDGLRIASGSADGFVRVWDAETGALIAAPFEGHTSDIHSVAFSPDGQWIASGSADKSVCVWNAVTGALIAGPFAGHTGTVYSVAFSPDGKRIASGSADKSVRVWNLETGVLSAAPFKGHTDDINSVVFSPDGRRIVSGSDDRSVRVCDAETGALVAGPFKGHTAEVCSVAFSPTGKHIASGSADQSVRVWDAETGVLSAAPFEGHTDWIRSIAFSPGGQRIASGSDDCSTRVWDVKSGALVAGPIRGHTGYIRSVAFSPDGQRIASGSDDKSVRIWRAESGVLSATPFLEKIGSISSAVISPDGRRVAAASGGSVRVWDVETGALSAGPFEGHTRDIWSVAFSPDGQRIASGSEDGSVRVWDTQTGALVAGPFKGHIFIVNSVAFSPDGRRIASGSWDESIRVWDAETGALVAGPFKGHTHSITSVAFSPDGRRIVSGSWDQSVRVWDAQTGALIAGPFEGQNWHVTSVVFSPDGQRIASGSLDESVRVWNAETGVLVAGPFKGHTNTVTSVAFSPNGQYIASGSDDRSVRILDAQTGALIRGPEEHTDPVVSLAFSSDGHRLLSSSKSTIRVDNFTQMISSPRGTTSTSPDGISPHDAGDGFTSDSGFEHGWMRNRKGELLFWVPPEHRAELWWPHRIAVISSKRSTRLDLEHFVHGEDWAQCYEERR
ncbi:hypothetical protein HWV62_32539 [Athelia sp. TMB]|nr:hypothetical protein HWV62_32539 [Athelia sp. TMB]